MQINDKGISSNLLQEAVLSSAEWVNNVLTTASIMILTIAGLRISGKPVVTWGEIEFNLEFVWVIFSLLTIAHIYTSYNLIRAVITLHKNAAVEIRMETLDKLSFNGGIFFRGIKPSQISKDKKGTVLLFRKRFDATFWVAALLDVSMLVLMMPDLTNPTVWNFFRLIIACFLFIINWNIASGYNLALTKLVTENYIHGDNGDGEDPALPFIKETIGLASSPAPGTYLGGRSEYAINWFLLTVYCIAIIVGYLSFFVHSTAMILDIISKSTLWIGFGLMAITLINIVFYFFTKNLTRYWLNPGSSNCFTGVPMLFVLSFLFASLKKAYLFILNKEQLETTPYISIIVCAVFIIGSIVMPLTFFSSVEKPKRNLAIAIYILWLIMLILILVAVKNNIAAGSLL